jgi:hypothetical protein
MRDADDLEQTLKRGSMNELRSLILDACGVDGADNLYAYREVYDVLREMHERGVATGRDQAIEDACDSLEGAVAMQRKILECVALRAVETGREAERGFMKADVIGDKPVLIFADFNKRIN